MSAPNSVLQILLCHTSSAYDSAGEITPSLISLILGLEVTRRYARLSDKTREEEYFKAMERIVKGEVDEDDQCDY